MISKLKLGVLAVASLPLVACDAGTVSRGAPAVGSATDLSSFVGARAGQAEMGLQNLGYDAVRTEGLTAFWFNRATGACARIVTGDGRYQSVTMIPAEDC